MSTNGIATDPHMPVQLDSTQWLVEFLLIIGGPVQRFAEATSSRPTISSTGARLLDCRHGRRTLTTATRTSASMTSTS